jgi:hypothetical protein
MLVFKFGLVAQIILKTSLEKVIMMMVIDVPLHVVARLILLLTSLPEVENVESSSIMLVTEQLMPKLNRS